jgi:hypothetical protein
MDILYTDETLIQFYYGECDVPETFEIAHVLENDIDHNHHYSNIYNEIQQMKKDNKSPSHAVLDKILMHSRA